MYVIYNMKCKTYNSKSEYFFCRNKYRVDQLSQLNKVIFYCKVLMAILLTLGAETFASRKIREIFPFREHKLSRIGHNIIFLDREVFLFVVVLRKRLDPDRNKREKKTLLFQAFVVLGLVFEHQTFF